MAQSEHCDIAVVFHMYPSRAGQTRNVVFSLAAGANAAALAPGNV